MKHEKYPILVNQIIAFQIQKSMIHFLNQVHMYQSAT